MIDKEVWYYQMFTRICGNGYCHIILVKVKIGTSSLETNLVIAIKVKMWVSKNSTIAGLGTTTLIHIEK